MKSEENAEKSQALEAVKGMFDEFKDSSGKDNISSANSGKYIQLKVVEREKLKISKKPSE